MSKEGISYEFDGKGLLQKIDEMDEKAIAFIKMMAQNGAEKMENYAKTHRRWKDRTSHARQRLTGYTEVSGERIRVCIAHGVEYGIHLELGHGKKYAILQEAVNSQAEEIMEGFKTMWEEISG